MTNTSEDIDQEFSEILAAIGREDRADAVRRAVAAYDGGLEHPLIFILAAEGMEAEGRVEDAIALLRQATEQAPEGAEGWRRLGGALARHVQPAEARTALDAALRIDPNIYWTQYMAGVVSAQMNDLDAAEGYYHRAVALDPSQAEPRAALEAIAEYRRKLAETAAAPAESPKNWGFKFQVKPPGSQRIS
jgi:tetratricopeptide (TPR) repeat protein